MATDIFEKIFGERPKKGYKLRSIDITVVDTDAFKGFNIVWMAQGIGFGEVFVGWGLNHPNLKDFPEQQGFHADTEFMSEKFVQALMKEAAPKIAEIIIKNDNTV